MLVSYYLAWQAQGDKLLYARQKLLLNTVDGDNSLAMLGTLDKLTQVGVTWRWWTA